VDGIFPRRTDSPVIRPLLVTVLILFNLQATARAATCSCAGAPVLVYLDTSATEKGDLFISYTAEDHQINDLVSGSDDVHDETGRDRNTFSHVLSASYALSDRWSISALASYVEHDREIGTSIFGKTTVSGWGDSVLLARYTPRSITPFSRHQVSLGAGVRIPTGENDVRTGFIVSEDMQPGTGAYAGIAWASYAYAFSQAATLQYFAAANYTHNDENDRHYAFGHEYNITTGLSHSPGERFSYSVGFRFRHAEPDERRGFEIPNTGGKWLDFVPAVRYAFTENLSATLSGRIPVDRDLNGALQFTTSHSYALSVTYGF
jgi:hypothetical protein